MPERICRFHRNKLGALLWCVGIASRWSTFCVQYGVFFFNTQCGCIIIGRAEKRANLVVWYIESESEAFQRAISSWMCWAAGGVMPVGPSLCSSQPRTAPLWRQFSASFSQSTTCTHWNALLGLQVECSQCVKLNKFFLKLMIKNSKLIVTHKVKALINRNICYLQLDNQDKVAIIKNYHMHFVTWVSIWVI